MCVCVRKWTNSVKGAGRKNNENVIRVNVMETKIAKYNAKESGFVVLLHLKIDERQKYL